MTTNKKYLIATLVVVVAIGTAFFFEMKKNNVPVPTQTVVASITNQAVTTDTSSWTLYTNKTYNFSIKFPTTYERQPGTDQQTTCIRLKSTISPCVVLISVYDNKDNLALQDYINAKPKRFTVDGPLISYNFNGYDSLFNKNQPGMYVFMKKDLYVYRFVATTASSNKEAGDIVATFKFTQ